MACNNVLSASFWMLKQWCNIFKEKIY